MLKVTGQIPGRQGWKPDPLLTAVLWPLTLLQAAPGHRPQRRLCPKAASQTGLPPLHPRRSPGTQPHFLALLSQAESGRQSGCWEKPHTAGTCGECAGWGQPACPERRGGGRESFFLLRLLFSCFLYHKRVKRKEYVIMQFESQNEELPCMISGACICHYAGQKVGTVRLATLPSVSL